MGIYIVTKHHLSRCFSNTAGNTSVFMALALMPLLLSAGVAIDFNRINERKSSLQAALDAAVLASAASEDALTEAEALKFFDAYAGLSDITINAISIVKGEDGKSTGTIDASMRLGLMGISGLASPDIRLSSSAKGAVPEKLDQVTFQITNAQGAYDKEIYFFTKDEDGDIIEETLVLDYDYTYKSGKGTKKFKPPVTSSSTITAGEYATYGVRMVVYEDTSYTGKHIKPKSYSSDEEDVAKWSKVTGECTDGQTQNWEDGGDSNYLDFVFKVNCTTKSFSSGDIRLTN